MFWPMNKITYQLHVFDGETRAYTWEAMTPFVTIHKGELLKVPGWNKAATVTSVSHEFEENTHVGDGAHLIQRTIVRCN